MMPYDMMSYDMMTTGKGPKNRTTPPPCARLPGAPKPS